MPCFAASNHCDHFTSSESICLEAVVDGECEAETCILPHMAAVGDGSKASDRRESLKT